MFINHDEQGGTRKSVTRIHAAKLLSALMILIANSVPVVGILWMDWDGPAAIAFYFLESAVIFLFVLIKSSIAFFFDPASGRSLAGRLGPAIGKPLCALLFGAIALRQAGEMAMPILSADGQILGNDELLNLTIDQMTVPLVILVVENAVLLYWSYVLPQRYLSTDGEDVGEDLIDRGILMLILPLMAGISVAGAFSVSGSTASPAFFVAFVVVVSIVKIGIEQAISFRIIRRA